MSPDGILLVDKPAGWTSHDVVGRVRRLAGTRRVGHAGTLDPMATGVLVLGIGRATRLLTYLVGCDKTYAATIRLGVGTVTDDAEGEIVTTAGAAGVDEPAVRAAVAGFLGEIEQVPSAVSAVKIEGERAYKRVRAGEDVTIPARPVTVHRYEVRAVRHTRQDDVPVLDVDVEVEVSSGTYVRALARDLGAVLGCGGHLTALRRTRVGDFLITSCHRLEDLHPDGALPVLPLAEAAAAAFPVRLLSAEQARAVRYGQRIDAEVPGREGVVAALGPGGDLVALLAEPGPAARSRVVFPAPTS